MTTQKKLKIKIFDREYALIVEDEDIAKELAAYVNTIMEETKNELPGQSAQTIATIACLNIAYDMFTESRKHNQMLNQIETKIQNLKHTLQENNLSK